MKYTQAELEGMSDLELNLIVAELQESGEGSEFDKVINRELKRSVEHGRIDYCNNWSDCGALIDECGIGLYHPSFDRKEWSAYIIDEFISVGDNPKRAVTIVYILINQGG